MVSRIDNKSHQCDSAAGYDHDPLARTAHAVTRRTRSRHRRPNCSPDDHRRRLRRTTCVEIRVSRLGDLGERDGDLLGHGQPKDTRHAGLDVGRLVLLAHGGPLPRGALGGSPETYQTAGLRWGTATSTSTRAGTTSDGRLM